MKCLIIFVTLFVIRDIVAKQGAKTETDILDICDDWISYKSEKCIKIMNRVGTEEEAKQVCSQMDRKATMMTIESEEEQEFVNEEVVKYREMSDKMWLGVDIHKLVLNPWHRETVYTNWAEGSADLIGYHSCVQMSLSKASLGKWSDEPCRRKGLIACQYPQHWTVHTLRRLLENITKRLNDMKCVENIENMDKTIEILVKQMKRQENISAEQNKAIVSMNKTFFNELKELTKELSMTDNDDSKHQNMIPIGFIYIQLPNQTEPREIWPHMSWSDITGQYAGLFFRAEGGKSMPFGQKQRANYSMITNVMSAALVDVKYSKVQGQQYVIPEQGWSSNLVPAKALSDLYLHYSKGENRPINTAVRIWKCTGRSDDSGRG